EYARQRSSRTAVARSGVDAIAWLPVIVAAGFPLAIFWRGRRRTDAGATVRPPAPRTAAGKPDATYDVVWWVLPAIALVTIILIYPMLDLIRLSLTDATVAGTR